MAGAYVCMKISENSPRQQTAVLYFHIWSIWVIATHMEKKQGSKMQKQQQFYLRIDIA